MTAAIIQARMGASRLPGKVLKSLCGHSVLWHVVDRLKRCKLLDEIIIATTTAEIDSRIAAEAEKAGVKYFRGSEEDVLARYYNAAREHAVDVIVRITSDCPLIDPDVSDLVIKTFFDDECDYANNIEPLRTYPRGFDTEVFSFAALERAHLEARERREREHVTQFMHTTHRDLFRIRHVKNDVDYSRYRWTLDTPEDWELIHAVYHELYGEKPDFRFCDVLDLFEQRPELARVNAHIEQKEL